MRKRLRKKKRLGEFREFGVEIRITLNDQTDYWQFLDDWIEKAVEANDLAFGGGGKDLICSGFLELGRADVFRGNLENIECWLSSCADVKSFTIGEPIDACA